MRKLGSSQQDVRHVQQIPSPHLADTLGLRYPTSFQQHRRDALGRNNECRKLGIINRTDSINVTRLHVLSPNRGQPLHEQIVVRLSDMHY